ncbi:MAG: hypothetical protein IPN17_32580 [Deltaproteobacteria bacterium]|nr:hypothetical protein [Deltaproteobacteria bacterium]
MGAAARARGRGERAAPADRGRPAALRASREGAGTARRSAPGPGSCAADPRGPRRAGRAARPEPPDPPAPACWRSGRAWPWRCPGGRGDLRAPGAAPGRAGDPAARGGRRGRRGLAAVSRHRGGCSSPWPTTTRCRCSRPTPTRRATPSTSAAAAPRSGSTCCAVPRLVARRQPALRAEMDLFVHQIVPVGYHDQRHLSASYQESIGTIYMTLHPNLMTMTEALIHEFSHNKINALFELDPVLDNAFWPLYASPVRPDPRPLHGVVLAVHAFQPIARLYEAMTAAGEPVSKSPDFQRRFAQIRKVNRDGAEVVLGHGVPTAVGRGLLDEMRRWDEHFTE